MPSTNKIDVEFEEFMGVFPSILEDVVAGIEDGIFNLKDHMDKLVRYIVPNGKKIRGLLVPAAYRMLEKEERLTPENLRLSYILGWSIEIGHAAQLVIDDIVVRSETRRGVPCWHTRRNIDVNGINDGLLLEQAVYYLLRRHFCDHPHILTIYQNLHHDLWYVGGGKVLEYMFTRNRKPDLTLFTIENYKSVVKYKNAYYTLCAPVVLAMCLADILDEKLHEEARSVLFEIGEIRQIQDDFLDCFGNVEYTGNRGQDIRQGKCTWLAVKALEKANSEQRKIMEEHYGSTEPEAVKIVCSLYETLDLVKLYVQYERESFDKIQARIRQVSGELPRQLFSEILGKLSNRKF